ncbi:hypothetical protein FKM82_025529 [Ascaphus truei]
MCVYVWVCVYLSDCVSLGLRPSLWLSQFHFLSGNQNGNVTTKFPEIINKDRCPDPVFFICYTNTPFMDYHTSESLKWDTFPIYRRTSVLSDTLFIWTNY